MILYHVTTDESLDSILKDGLKPLIGERSIKIEKHPAIYLFPTINIPENFKVEKTCEYEVCTYNPIPPKYINYLRKEDF